MLPVHLVLALVETDVSLIPRGDKGPNSLNGFSTLRKKNIFPFLFTYKLYQIFRFFAIFRLNIFYEKCTLIITHQSSTGVKSHSMYSPSSKSLPIEL